MIELRDVTTIGVPPDQVWAWFESLPEHYLEWHPDHIRCNWSRGSAVTEGAEMEVVEVLHGRPHHFRLRLTDVIPGHRACYRIVPGVEGCLEVEPADSGSRFTATVRLGIRARTLGSLLDFALRKLFGAQIEAIRRHQAQEGANLKRLLEHAGSDS